MSQRPSLTRGPFDSLFVHIGPTPAVPPPEAEPDRARPVCHGPHRRRRLDRRRHQYVASSPVPRNVPSRPNHVVTPCPAPRPGSPAARCAHTAQTSRSPSAACTTSTMSSTRPTSPTASLSAGSPTVRFPVNLGPRHPACRPVPAADFVPLGNTNAAAGTDGLSTFEVNKNIFVQELPVDPVLLVNASLVNVVKSRAAPCVQTRARMHTRGSYPREPGALHCSPEALTFSTTGSPRTASRSSTEPTTKR